MKQLSPATKQRIKSTLVATGTLVAVVVSPTVFAADAEVFKMPLMDPAPVLDYIKETAKGPVFQIGAAGVMFSVGVKGIKRVKGVF